MKTKELTFAALLTALVMVIEVLAARTGETLVILTVFSTLPIYILTRKKMKMGVISYIVVGLILLLTNIHQLFFFLFTNGLIGLFLGGLSQMITNRKIVIGLTAYGLTVGLFIVSALIGFGLLDKFGPISILGGWIFSVIYCGVYEWIARSIYKRIDKWI